MKGNVANIPNHTGGLITYMRTDSLIFQLLQQLLLKKLLKMSMEKITHFQNQELLQINCKKGAQKRLHRAIRPVDMEFKTI